MSSPLRVTMEKEIERVIVISMITEVFGKQYRSFVTLSNGSVREGYGETAQLAEKRALLGLNVDWSRLLAIF